MLRTQRSSAARSWVVSSVTLKTRTRPPARAVALDGRRLGGLIPDGVESRDLGGWREVMDRGAWPVYRFGSPLIALSIRTNHGRRLCDTNAQFCPSTFEYVSESPVGRRSAPTYEAMEARAAFSILLTC